MNGFTGEWAKFQKGNVKSCGGGGDYPSVHYGHLPGTSSPEILPSPPFFYDSSTKWPFHLTSPHPHTFTSVLPNLSWRDPVLYFQNYYMVDVHISIVIITNIVYYWFMPVAIDIVTK